MAGADCSVYQPGRSPLARVKRRLTQWRRAVPIAAVPAQAVISVSFDDFPRTAARLGAQIVESFGGRATYYACSGLAGKTNHMGEMYQPEDVRELARRGHEIGAHSHGHIDYAQAPDDEIQADIEQNLAQLEALDLDQPIRSFAYPFGETRPTVKDALAHRFHNARGVLAGINRSGRDRMQLRAAELTPEDWTLDRAEKLIHRAIARKEWLILFTHDVDENASPFGVTPGALSRLLQVATSGGARISTVSEALQQQ